MLLHTAHLTCHNEIIDRFKARLLKHARTTLDNEPGCHRFDVHQEDANPSLFLLIEAYADAAALEIHRQSAHYKAFREDTKDWVVDRKWWFWTKVGPVML